MNAAPDTVRVPEARAVNVPIGPANPAAALGPPAPPAITRVAVRVGADLVPRAVWSVSRTGRAGLVGIALLLAAAVFLVSTHLQVAAEVVGLREDLATASSRASTAATEVTADPAAGLRTLPGRAEVPALLRHMFDEATRAALSVDTAKYEVVTTKGSGVVRYQIAFPVTGPYPQIRTFIDSILATMPAVGLRDLALERKAIGDAEIEAQLRFTIYTRSAP